MSDYKTELQSNNVDLQAALDLVRTLPDKGVEVEVSNIVIRGAYVIKYYYTDENGVLTQSSELGVDKTVLRNSIIFIEVTSTNGHNYLRGVESIYQGSNCYIVRVIEEDAGILITNGQDGGGGN